MDIDKIKEYAKEYREDAQRSLIRNSHMNNFRELVCQDEVDAVLVDFINFIAAKYGIDYGLYTKDIYLTKDENECCNLLDKKSKKNPNRCPSCGLLVFMVKTKSGIRCTNPNCQNINLE